MRVMVVGNLIAVLALWPFTAARVEAADAPVRVRIQEIPPIPRTSFPMERQSADQEGAPRPNRVCAIYVSRDRKRLIVGTEDDPKLFFFSLPDLRLRAVRPMDAFAHRLTLTGRGDWIACDEEGYTGPIRCFLIDTASYQLRHILHGAVDMAELCFTADGRFLNGLSYGDLFRWRVADGARIFKRTLLGRERYWDTHLVFVPASEGRIVACQDLATKRWSFWNTATGRRLRRRRAVCWPEGEVLDWFVTSGRPCVLLRAKDRNAGPQTSIRLLQTSIRLLLIDPYNGQILRILGPTTAAARASLSTREGRVSPDGTLVGLRVAGLRQIALFSLRTGERMRLLDPLSGTVDQDWRFVGPRCIVAAFGDRCVFWDTASGAIRLVLIPDLQPSGNAMMRAGEWIAYTPEGCYTGSKDCLTYFRVPGASPRHDPAAIGTVLTQLLH